MFTSVFEHLWWTLNIVCIVSDFIEWFELLFALVGCILHNIVMPPTQGGLGWAGLGWAGLGWSRVTAKTKTQSQLI